MQYAVNGQLFGLPLKYPVVLLHAGIIALYCYFPASGLSVSDKAKK